MEGAFTPNSIYLLPEFDLESEMEIYLEKVCEEIFAEQLNSGCRAEELWPRDLTLAVFHLWFECRFYSMLFDLVDGPHEVPLLADLA